MCASGQLLVQLLACSMHLSLYVHIYHSAGIGRDRVGILTLNFVYFSTPGKTPIIKIPKAARTGPVSQAKTGPLFSAHGNDRLLYHLHDKDRHIRGTVSNCT